MFCQTRPPRRVNCAALTEISVECLSQGQYRTSFVLLPNPRGPPWVGQGVGPGAPLAQRALLAVLQVNTNRTYAPNHGFILEGRVS